MPPIQIHRESPINTTAAKASGILSPRTTGPPPPYSPTKVNNDAPTSPTAGASPFQDWPIGPLAGATPFLGPTPSARGVPASPSTPSPTRTTSLPQYDGPPPPQPGAVPSPSPYAPPYLSSPSPSFNSSTKAPLSPPPKAGDRRTSNIPPSLITGTPASMPGADSYSPLSGTPSSQNQSHYITSPTGAQTGYTFPPQASIPAPSTNYAPTHSTSTYTGSMAQPTTLPATSPPETNTPRTMSFAYSGANVAPGPISPTPSWTAHAQSFSGAAAPALGSQHDRRGSLQNPPGYVQDPHAGEMTAAQRATQQAREKEDSVFSSLTSGGGFTGNNNGNFTLGGVADGFGGGGWIPGTNSNASGGSIGGVGGEPVMGTGRRASAFQGIAESVNGEGAAKAWEGMKGWLGGVAEKVGEVEGEVWRRVGGK